METISYPKWNPLSVVAVAACLFLCRWITPHSTSNVVVEFPKIQIETQKAQSKELLHHALRGLTGQELEASGREFIFDVVESSLPYHYRVQAPLIAKTLIEEANRWGLDPIFLLAVIKTESQFNPKAKGRKGDRGLMQLLPKTGAWMAKRLKWQNAQVDLFDPVINIKIGAAYFAQLRKHFGNVGSRYLSAYNMGTKNVHRLLKQDVEPMIYAKRVLKNYSQFYRNWSAKVAANRPSPHKHILVSLND
jgi:soluble lytic murein transglycosylase